MVTVMKTTLFRCLIIVAFPALVVFVGVGCEPTGAEQANKQIPAPQSPKGGEGDTQPAKKEVVAPKIEPQPASGQSNKVTAFQPPVKDIVKAEATGKKVEIGKNVFLEVDGDKRR